MVEKVKKYIADNKLLAQGAKVIIGISGGADSVALLDILIRLGYDCIVAHCNFHLRAEESDRDALFVENISKQYKLPFEKIDFDTQAYASEKGVSIEMAARELRYSWFEVLLSKYNATCIAVAHHRDDSVETTLLNLIRGTGIRGLTGISARNNNLIRPLLCISRKEILDYITEKGLTFVEDSTNNENIYTRNKIRLDIIPLLETINPSVKDAIRRTSENLMQVENIYKAYIDNAKNNILIDNKISINKLIEYTEPKAILYEILAGYNFNRPTINQIFETLDKESGKFFYSESHQLLKDREYLLLKEREILTDKIFYIEEHATLLPYPIHLEIITIKNNEGFNIEKNRDILYADKNKLCFPLTLRRWQQGDWFVPFGMKGKKKISDYFSDQKFSVFDKENTWLLCSGKDIVWIVGHRSDNRYSIDDSTIETLRIVYSKG